MVLDYYNLRKQPFGVTPDPRYLYPSPTHREALASLSYAIQCGRASCLSWLSPEWAKPRFCFSF